MHPLFQQSGLLPEGWEQRRLHSGLYQVRDMLYRYAFRSRDIVVLMTEEQRTLPFFIPNMSVPMFIPAAFITHSNHNSVLLLLEAKVLASC